LLRAEKKAVEVVRINTNISENNEKIEAYLKKMKQLRNYDYVRTLLESKNQHHVYSEFL